MKHFSLEEYLKNPERKVVTRDGRSVRIVCSDLKSKYNRPIIGLISEYGHEGVYTFTEQGLYLGGGNECNNDLFFAPQIHKRWGIMTRENRIISTYPSKGSAENACGTCFKVVEITWEE